MMNEFGVSEEDINSVKAGEIVEYEVIPSGFYCVEIEKAYNRTTDSGAKMFRLEGSTVNLKNEREAVSWETCVASGDDKGNKSTYTDKRTGKEKLLPGVEQVTNLFKVVGVNISTTKVIDANVEFGSDKKIIDVRAFTDLTGKKFGACIRQYENEYNGDISIRYDIELFTDLDGKNFAGEDVVTAFVKKIEKSPIKKIRAKSASSSAGSSAGNVSDAMKSW